jgi:hypothetical protein
MDVIVQRHGLLKKHHEQTKELELKQLANLHKSEQKKTNKFDFSSLFFYFRMRNEFTHKQHQTELINLNEYSTRRQKELLKRHAFNQKQFPKNIKVEN